MQINSDPNFSHESQGGDAPLYAVGQTVPFFLVTALFFIWGLSNNLTDILVQQFKKSFELSPLQAQLVQTSVFLGYFFMAIPAGLLMRKKGYKAGILAGLLLFGVGTLLFWPAAIIGKYSAFLMALFFVGCGSAVLETAANPFIAQMGNTVSSERRLNFAQAFNPPGTITGVLLGTYLIFSGVELAPNVVNTMKAAGTYDSYLHTEILRVVPTYVVLGCVVLLWAALIAFFELPTMRGEQENDASVGGLLRLRHYPQLWKAVVTQFVYVGAQVATWSAFIPYMKQYTGVTERAAALYLTGNLIAFAAGRILSTAAMKWFRPVKLMGVYAVVNIALLAVAILHPGMTGAIAVMLTSFFMSVMFPTIFALGVKGLGGDTKLGSSVIVMSVVGAAVLPPVLGLVARESGSYALAYAVPCVSYLMVAFYAYRVVKT